MITGLAGGWSYRAWRKPKKGLTYKSTDSSRARSVEVLGEPCETVTAAPARPER